MSNPFHGLLAGRAERLPLGTWVMSASPLVAEAMGRAGFDWCVIDMEHTPLDMMEVVHLLQAVAGTRMVPTVRVPWNETVTIKRVMDAGANTLLVPFVQNADEARRAVAATRYPPQGIRGMAGMSRASGFGTTPNYLTQANDGVCVLLQLETPQAVAELEAIAAVPGVDGIFLGPGDLSAAMGHVGQPAHPEVFALMQDTAQRCRKLGMPVGTVGGNPDLVRRYVDAGFDFVAIASDLGLLMQAAQGAVAALKTPGAAPAPRASSGY
jgi:2-keto-3-deoxy-L-rhamnonate aldolase RhmA